MRGLFFPCCHARCFGLRSHAHAAAAAASYRLGALDKKELRRAVRSLGYYATTEDINEFFRMCDFSGDGMIDFAEMKRALNAFLKGQAPSPPQPASASLQQLLVGATKPSGLIHIRQASFATARTGGSLST